MVYQIRWSRFIKTTFFVWLAVRVFAQNEYQPAIYTVKDGLNSEQCRRMHRDKAGFLWITSDKGLNRFDGNSFYTFRHRPDDPLSIANNSCYGMLEDKKGRLWINTDDGLSLFDHKKQTFQNYYPDTTVLPVMGISYTEMAEDHAGRIWIGGYYDVLIFNPAAQKFEKSGWYGYALKNGIIKEEKRNSITQSVVKKSETELWLMTVYGLFSVHTPTKTFTYHPNPAIDDYFAFGIHHVDKNGILWIGTYNQCFYTYEPKTRLWSHFACPPREKGISDMISDIDRYDDHTLMMTRTDEVFLFNTITGEWRQFIWRDKKTDQIFTGYSNTLIADDKIYVTANGNQPFMLLANKKSPVKKIKIPLPKNIVNNHSYITPEGKILTGDWDKNAVYACDKTTCTLLTENNGNAALGNLQLYYTSRGGDHYFSTSRKIYRWNPSDNTVKLLSGDIDEELTEFRNFVEDDNGNMYIRERNKGIYILKKGKTKIEYYNCGIPSGNFSALYYDLHTGKLWLATEKNGLFIIDPVSNAYKHYSLMHLAQTNKGFIYDISGDDNGNVFLLIANRGLVKINSRDMVPKLYTSSDGLNSDAVKYGCISENKYWFTTESGLMAFDYANERFYAFEQDADSKLFTYRIFPDKEGNITQNLYPEQIISFDKNAITESIFQPEIYLKEVKLSGKIIPHDSVFTTSFDRNNFVFLFGNIGTTGLHSKEYLYRINGQSWQPLENSMINLYNLSPGSYILQVGHKYNLKNLFSLRVVVIPPWWKSTWFYAAASLLFLLTVFWVYQKRISMIRKEEAEKNQLKQRITEIEMTALRAQMNPHFIFNCLNSINRFILVNDTEAASSYLTKFSRLIRIILDGSREDFISLEKEMEALKLYIDMESMRFQDSFDWNIHIDPEINLPEILIPPLVLQPYVENAIWHGLMQAPAGYPKKLDIRIDQSNQSLTIEITDNGIGRSKASEIRSKDGNKHKSYGITLTEERLKWMEKVKGIKTDVRIDDLTDQKGNAAGTKVSLHFILNTTNP